jgi:hypothetical protein
LRDASASGVSASQQLDISRFDFDCSGEGVDPRHSRHGWVPTAEVQCRPYRRGDRHTGHQVNFVVLDTVSVRLDPRWTAPILVNQLHDLYIIDPLAAMQSSCSEACDNTPTSGPQPPCLRTKPRIDVDITFRIDVREQSAAPRSQLGLGQSPCVDGLAADEWLSHDSSVAGRCHHRHFSCPHVAERAADRTLERECGAGRTFGDELAQDQT